MSPSGSRLWWITFVSYIFWYVLALIVPILYSINFKLFIYLGNSEMVKKLAESTNSNGKNNISFLSYLLLGDLDKCLQLLIETDRLPEAAFFARSYLPSKMSYVVGLWKDSLSKTNIKASESLANPDEYENLFPNYQESLKTEVYLQAERKRQLPAAAYANTPVS
jgi:coatomer subunit beta'